MDWSSVTSNLIIPSLIALAGFAWSKLHGEKTDSWSDAITGIGKQLVHQLVMLTDTRAQSWSDAAVAFMTSKVAALGIPRNAITDGLIKATIEHAIGDALAELRAAAQEDDRNLNAIASESKATLDSFAAAQAEGLARVSAMKDLIEVVPPDSPAAATIAKPAPPAESK